MTDNNNPLQSPIVLIAVAIVIFGALKKCGVDVPEAAPPMQVQNVPTLEALWAAFTTYVVPAILGSGVVILVCSLLCRFAVMSDVHSVDHRQIALSISVLSAMALIWPGIPDPYNKWKYGVWAALIILGPLGYWLIASTQTQTEDEEFSEKVAAPLKDQISSLERSLTEIQSRESELECDLRIARQQVAQFKAQENERLEKEKAEQNRKGILDSSDF